MNVILHVQQGSILYTNQYTTNESQNSQYMDNRYCPYVMYQQGQIRKGGDLTTSAVQLRYIQKFLDNFKHLR